MDLLGDYRTEIDKIDKEMTKLLEKRMNISKSISKYKMEHDMQIFHPEREKIVIEKNKGYLENKEYGDLVESYYDNLMYLSRLVQQKEIYSENNIYTKPYKNDRENLVVGYQGVPGSFGNEAMLKYFKNIKEAKSYEKFEDVFKAVEDGEIEYGILPVENSSTGGIGTVEDLLKEYNLYIVGEECIRISQNLVGIKGATVDDIKEVYSHPQGFEQSTKFFDKHKDYNLIPYSNTAISAKLVSDLKDKSKENHELVVKETKDIILFPCDAQLIVQVLVNLLDNAFKHTPDASKVMLKAFVRNNNIIFQVIDNGKGIEIKQLNHIFDDFFTTSLDNGDHKRGIGLGLAICKAIVEAHKGEIKAFNNDLGGATFELSLPLEEENNE